MVDATKIDEKVQLLIEAIQFNSRKNSLIKLKK